MEAESRSARQIAVQEARAQLTAHPGYVEHMRIRALIITLTEVFEPNFRDLIAVLDQVSTGSDHAIQMLLAVSSSQVGSGITAEVNRHLHNYVAGAATLVDHVRRVTRDREDRVTAEYAKLKEAALTNPEISFIVQLRNFALHRSLPLLGYTLRVTKDGNQDVVEHSEVELSVTDLLEGEKWSSTTRHFIAAHGDRLPLRPVILRHYELVHGLNVWLINAMQQQNRFAMADANELVVAVNAAMMGVDTETARRRTDEESSRRAQS